MWETHIPRAHKGAQFEALIAELPFSMRAGARSRREAAPSQADRDRACEKYCEAVPNGLPPPGTELDAWYTQECGVWEAVPVGGAPAEDEEVVVVSHTVARVPTPQGGAVANAALINSVLAL